jgi:hypothetical protein
MPLTPEATISLTSTIINLFTSLILTWQNRQFLVALAGRERPGKSTPYSF